MFKKSNKMIRMLILLLWTKFIFSNFGIKFYKGKYIINKYLIYLEKIFLRPKFIKIKKFKIFLNFIKIDVINL